MNGVYACSLRSEVIKYYLLVLGSWFGNKVLVTTTDIIIHSTITVDVVISHTKLSVIIQRDKNAGTTAPLCFIFNIKVFQLSPFLMYFHPK